MMSKQVWMVWVTESNSGTGFLDEETANKEADRLAKILPRGSRIQVVSFEISDDPPCRAVK